MSDGFKKHSQIEGAVIFGHKLPGVAEALRERQSARGAKALDELSKHIDKQIACLSSKRLAARR